MKGRKILALLLVVYLALSAAGCVIEGVSERELNARLSFGKISCGSISVGPESIMITWKHYIGK